MIINLNFLGKLLGFYESDEDQGGQKQNRLRIQQNDVDPPKWPKYTRNNSKIVYSEERT